MRKGVKAVTKVICDKEHCYFRNDYGKCVLGKVVFSAVNNDDEGVLVCDNFELIKKEETGVDYER